MHLKEFLRQLLRQQPGECVGSEPADIEIAGVTSNSRSVKPGYLFVAITGTKVDGLSFVNDAVASGAAAIIAERLPSQTLAQGVAFIKVENARRALALAAGQF